MRVIEGKLLGTGLSVGIVASRFNELITSRLLDGAKDVLLRHDVSHNAIDVFWVPGAWELPLTVKEIALMGKYDAIIQSNCPTDSVPIPAVRYLVRTLILKEWYPTFRLP